MSYEQILTDVADGIMTSTVNRPEKLNAWTFRMRDEVVDAITEANAANDIVAIVEKREPDFKAARERDQQ